MVATIKLSSVQLLVAETYIGMEQSQVIIVHFVGFFLSGCEHSALYDCISVGILKMTEVEEKGRMFTKNIYTSKTKHNL